MPTTNSSIQFKHGLQEAFSNITKDSNTIYFITDTNRLFVGDSEYTRPVQHGSELPTSKNPANSLFVKETGTSRELYYSKDGTAWDMIAYLPATITGGVFGDNTAGTVAYGGTLKVPKVTVDNRGYVTAAEDVTITLPASDKVTTVTTSGDGNAVTGGSISNDGATLTLTKGESFVPASGGTFSGDVTISGNLTSSDININTTNIYGIIDEDYPERLDTSKGKITFVNGGEPFNTDNPPTIEAEYEHGYAGPSHVYNRSYLRLNADKVETNNLNGFVFSYNYNNEDDSENGIIDSENGIIQLEYNENGTYTAIPSINIGYDHHIGGYYTSHVDLTARYLNLNGDVRLSYAPTNNMHAATKKYVDDSISSSVAASDAMVFKGTVGTSGTVASISVMDYSTAATGDTYKVITTDTLPAANSSDSSEHDLTPGDLIVYMGESKFIYVPSGDEDVTSVKIADSGDTINVSTTAQTGNLVLGTAAGVNTTSTVTNDSTTVPTTAAVKTYVDNAESLAMPKTGGTFTGAVTLAGAPTTDLNAATKKYVDDTVSGVTDTKVTTVTTTGDGNAVTGGSISADGTTLTLTKGQEFVPAYGITATQESYHDGPRSGTENTLNLLNLITMRQGRDNNYTSSIDPSINFTISPTVPDISTTGTPSASIVVNKGYVDNGRFIYKGTIGTNGDFSSIDDALDYAEYGSQVCAVKGSLYLITSNMTLEQSKACIMNNGFVSYASNDISLHAGDFIVVVQSTENYTYQSGDYANPGYYYLRSVSNVKFIVIPASSTHVSSIKIAGSGDTINVSTSSQKGELILGSAAGVNTTSTVTNDATTVPTTSAVKTYVDDAVTAATLTWKTF